MANICKEVCISDSVKLTSVKQMLNVVAFCFTHISFDVSNMQNFSLILAVPYQIFAFFLIFIDNIKRKRKEQTISINIIDIAFNYCSEKFKNEKYQS